MNKAKVKFNFFVAITIIVTLLLCGVATCFVRKNNIYALSNTSNGTLIANGEELYDVNTGKFNENAKTDLIEKLFDKSDPLQYVKSMKDSDTDSFVVPASIINNKINNGNGLIVNLGNKEWMVASLTIADINGKEDIVMTLYLANPEGKSRFNSSSANTKGTNAYGSSNIRNHLLTDSNWSLYNQTGENSFASKYLVQPKYIKYQHNQTCIGRGDYSNHFSNEGLDEFTTGWSNELKKDPYKPSDTFNDLNGVSQKYDAWGEDYIWLPSITETGVTDRYNKGANSIWKLNAKQLGFSGADYSWLRSGTHNSFAINYNVDSAGGIYSKTVNFTDGGIRPAIHLNLTELIASADTELDDPQDLTSTYNKNSHTIKSLATASKASWYNADIYEHVDNYIDITYHPTNPNNASVNDMINADDYWVKIEITQNYINAVNAQVDSEGAKFGWSADYIQIIKDRRKPKFLGTADTSETDTMRWIKVTINKAEIDLTNVVWSNSELEYNAQNQSVTITNLPSFLNITYKDNIASAVSTYVAQVVEITTKDDNYRVPSIAELVNYPKLKHTWKITKKKLTINWKTEDKTQDGKTIALPSLDFDNSMNISIVYTYYKDSTCLQQITLKQIYDEIDLTKVKTYYVKAKLNSSGGDYNSTNSVFLEGGTAKTEVTRSMQTGSNANPVSVTLSNSKVTFNGKEQEAIFQITGTSLENIIIYYFKADGTALQKAPTNAGKYKVRVQLKDNLKDYVLTGDTEFDFEIQSLRIEKPLIPNQVQFFQIDGYGIGDIVTLPKNWENYLTIKVFDTNNNEILPENGDWNFLNVGTYKIEISFKDKTNTSNGCDSDNVIWNDNDKGAYFVTLQIMPLVLTVGDWQTNNDNKIPTLTGIETSELEKYFDYIIYEMKGDIIIGNALPKDTILKAETNYQISIKVKDIYKGDVLVMYKGSEVDETEPFKFVNSISGGTGEDNNGGGEDDSNLWLGGGDGKIPLLVWILLASNLLTILMLVIIVIVLSRKKKGDRFDRVAPVASTSENIVNNDITDSNFANVNGKLITDKDWTFLVREQDILNIKALENQTERVIMYACKESAIKKVRKFHNTIVDVGRKELDSVLGEEENSKPNKKNKRKKR